MTPSPVTVGLISDTHGQFRPEIAAIFRGVDLIVHAGDVGGKSVLESLAAIARVEAVSGNEPIRSVAVVASGSPVLTTRSQAGPPDLPTTFFRVGGRPFFLFSSQLVEWQHFVSRESTCLPACHRTQPGMNQ